MTVTHLEMRLASSLVHLKASTRGYLTDLLLDSTTAQGLDQRLVLG